MKKIICTAFFLAFLLHRASPQSTVDHVRNARKVRDQITLTVLSPEAVDYQIDDERSKTLESVNYFQAMDPEFRIYANFVNPLQYRISLENAAVEDELYKASNTYINSARQFLQLLSGIKTEKNAPFVSGSPAMDSLGLFITSDPYIAELIILFRTFDSDFPVGYEPVLASMKKINTDSVRNNSIARLTACFSKLQGIGNAAQIEAILKENQAEIDKIGKSLEALKSEINQLANAVSAIGVHVENIDGNEKEVLKFKAEGLKNVVESLDEKMREIKLKYDKIEALFKDSRLDASANRLKLLALLPVNTGKRHEIKVMLEKITFNIKDLTISAGDKNVFLLHVRRYQRFIPSVSTGLFYSSLAFKRFGTGMDSTGQSIVVESEDLANPLVAGAHLNFYYNSSEDLNWLIQLGIGPTKEKPVLFLGTGAIYRDVQVTVGCIWSWQPKLNKLKPGQVIAGTSDIENDVSYKFDTKPRFYIGVGVSLMD